MPVNMRTYKTGQTLAKATCGLHHIQGKCLWIPYRHWANGPDFMRAMKKALVVWDFFGDYTTQLYGDNDNLL